MFRLAVIAVTATLLAACSSAPAPMLVAAAPVSSAIPYRWTTGVAPKAHKDMVATFGRLGLKPGEYLWATATPGEGEPRVVIDLLTQMAYAYRGEALVGAASVSSAKTGMVTPLGYWKVLQKKKMHRSRKYDNAPMPFMQRLDEYGIALHGGANPGYPASHGCVRMPMKFAEKLYGLTKIGSTVTIEG
ncbi:MAG: L,D-transpeptidase family protein [Sphingomicrobium sp.]